MDSPHFFKAVLLRSDALERCTVLPHQHSNIQGPGRLEAGIALNLVVCAFVCACRPVEAEEYQPVEFLEVVFCNVLIEMLENIVHRLVEILDHLNILFRLVRIDVAQDEFPGLPRGDSASFKLCGTGKELEDAVIERIDQFRWYLQDTLLHGDKRNLPKGKFLAMEPEDMLEQLMPKDRPLP